MGRLCYQLRKGEKELSERGSSVVSEKIEKGALKGYLIYCIR
jgi:hypothetical protein